MSWCECRDCKSKLDQLERQVRDLEYELDRAKRELGADLAALRRRINGVESSY